MREEGDDWVMRPVLAGLCSYTDLVHKLNLVDVARMNDALDVRAENQYRTQKAMER